MKIFAIFVAVMILFSVGLIIQPVEGKEAFAQDVGGFIYNSYDGNARLFTKQDEPWNGNISVIEMNDIETEDKMADDAWNDGTLGAESWDEEVRTGYTWKAYNDGSGNEKEAPQMWYSNPEEEGENVIFLAEYQHFDEKYGLINYTAISNLPATVNTPEYPEEHNIKYEPIPKPEVNEMTDKPVGPTWINISIPYFKYTDFNEKLGEPAGRGSFESFQSYAVFIRDSKGEQFKEWTYIGNSKPDPRWNEKAEPPLWANDLETDPSKINTGRDYFLADGLKEGLEYQFMVRVNFQSTAGDDMGGVWGYGGGLGEANINEKTTAAGDTGGSGTTFSSSGGGGYTPTSSPPSEPRNLTATGHDGYVALSWDPPTSDGGTPVENYKIYRDGSHIGSVSAPTTTYDDTAVTNGNTYEYYITAVNAAGEGPASDTDTATPKGPPTAPTTPDATEGNEYVLVSWSPPSNDGGEPITDYKIYRGTTSGGETYHATVSSSSTEYNDTTVEVKGDTYYYYITAVNSLGEGSASSEVSATPYTTSSISLNDNTQSDGWNFISLMVIPENTDLEAILEDSTYGITGSYEKVMYYDASAGQWKSYVPGRASHFNNLDTWNHKMGIWIQLSADATLTIMGTEPVSTDITLYPGWNMVGYPSTITGNNGLPTEVTKIGYFNASANYNVLYNYTPGTFNFEPGKAYWIYIDNSSPVIWTVDYKS